MSAIYNYSKVSLTENMKNVLSRGLNFNVTPEQINLTELLVDFRKFERSIMWKEYFRMKRGRKSENQRFSLRKNQIFHQDTVNS